MSTGGCAKNLSWFRAAGKMAHMGTTTNREVLICFREVHSCTAFSLPEPWRYNKEQGITVIANLHTRDTAKMYCDRIIGMKEGSIVFDGKPKKLTEKMARGIYGIDDDTEDEAFSTAITSTAINAA